MARWIWSDADARDGMSSVVVDGGDKGEGREMVILVVQLDSLFRRRGCIGDAYGILDEPFVDCLGGMGHEDSTAEVGFGKNVGEGGGMIEMETIS